VPKFSSSTGWRQGKGQFLRLKAETLNVVLTRKPVVLIEVGSDWIVEWLPMDGPHNLNWHCAPIAEKVQPFWLDIPVIKVV
jgi:hypothetical protein